MTGLVEDRERRALERVDALRGFSLVDRTRVVDPLLDIRILLARGAAAV